MDGGMRDVDRVTDVVMDGPFPIELLRSVSLRGKRRRDGNRLKILNKRGQGSAMVCTKKGKKKKRHPRSGSSRWHSRGWLVL